MPRRIGLGPQGHAAAQSAGEFFRDRGLGQTPAPVINESPAPEPISNPAALSVALPDESSFRPDWWYTFDSSRVKEAAYDKPNERLYVRWQDRGVGYIYEGVPENIWRGFRRAKSAGKYINSRLNNYNYHPGNF
jgi:hypothetical protein